jgi:hypothetical protein
MNTKVHIYFVGIHNKPGLQPLDSSARSGKLVDEIIKLLPQSQRCFKTNVYIDCVPDADDPKNQHGALSADGWLDRTDFNSETDIAIVLGGVVEEAFKLSKLPYLKLTHPSYVMRIGEQAEYVTDAVMKIYQAINDKLVEIISRLAQQAQQNAKALIDEKI